MHKHSQISTYSDHKGRFTVAYYYIYNSMHTRRYRMHYVSEGDWLSPEGCSKVICPKVQNHSNNLIYTFTAMLSLKRDVVPLSPEKVPDHCYLLVLNSLVVHSE